MRKVRTASGATAVQIASKTRGVRTIVEHIGSAHTEAELAVLIEVAKTKIQAGHLDRVTVGGFRWWVLAKP